MRCAYVIPRLTLPLLLLVLVACENKNEQVFKELFTKGGVLGTIITTPTTSITETSAESGGNLTDNGNSTILARGVCWDTITDPNISDNKTDDGNELGEFTSSVTGLIRGKTYYLRAYVTNKIGTAYGASETFTTLTYPSVITSAISGITDTTANSGGNIVASGGAFVSARGICWATKQNPTIADKVTTDGTGTGTFSSKMTGLIPNTTYHVKAYATNSIGTAYGGDQTFTASSIVSVIPTLSTTSVTAITQTTATSGGNITSNGGSSVSARGVCWSTSANPTIALTTKTSDGTGTGAFSSSISGLSANTLYYVRAYATNSSGTAYGNSINFFTSVLGWPIATTKFASNVAITTATLNGSVNANNQSTTVTFEYGTTIPYGNFTSANESPVSGSTTTNVTANIAGLTSGTLYHFRVKAVNPVGTVFSGDSTFTTLAVTLPTLTTTAVSSITWSQASSGGSITSDGGATITKRGLCWSKNTNPTLADSTCSYGSGIGTFAYTVTNLSPNTLYYLRAYATNSAGTAYGNEFTFTTSSGAITLPSLTTETAWSITQTTASTGGNITYNGGATIIASGVCWSTTANPTIALATKTNDLPAAGLIMSSLTGLTPNTIYYVRAYATNSAGTGYGNEINFRTLGTITDIDGNTYNTVSIGSQTWMAENLKSTRYRDGTPIPSTENSFTGSYYWYNNSTINKDIYGALYNFYAVTDNRKICPTGWHVPLNDEWSQLNTYLGVSTAGGQLKETGTSHWVSPNTGSTNSTGFSALPGGSGYGGSSCFLLGSNGYWWSSSQMRDDYAWNLNLTNTSSQMSISSSNMSAGCSVRCLQGENPVFPLISTSAISTISQALATCGGIITSDGGTNISTRGVCWNTSSSPTIADNKTIDGSGIGSFTSNLNGLSANTTYFLRAYATNSTGTSYGQEISFTTMDISGLAIGQSYQGGVIGYILRNGDLGYIPGETHGLIATPSDQSAGAEWGCKGTTITGADGTAVGTGFNNTTDIVNGCTTTGIAAKLCYDLILNGFTDWYLPSKDELIKLYLNRFAIGGFVSAYYWSSTEISDIGAWPVAFYTLSMGSNNKDNFHNVRAVRAF